MYKNNVFINITYKSVVMYINMYVFVSLMTTYVYGDIFL